MTSEHPVEFSGVLWDQGSLTRAGVSRFAQVPEYVALVPGNRTAELVKSGNFSSVCDEEAADLLQALRLLGGPVDRGRPVPLFLGVGTPFDGEAWTRGLLDDVERSGLPGVVVVIPGPPGPTKVVPLTGTATSYTFPVRDCIAKRLDLPPSQILVEPNFGLDSAAGALENQAGDLYLVFATQPLKPTPTSGAARPEVTETISASDTVHLILKDTGLEVSNRTGFAVNLKIRLGSPDGSVLGVLGTELMGRESEFYAHAELGPISHLEPPVPELRQWSHEAEVVYHGGEQRIHGVDIEYRSSDGTILGTARFGAPNSHVVSQVSTEISRTLGRSSHSMGSRLKQIPKNPGWRESLFQLRNPGSATSSSRS